MAISDDTRAIVAAIITLAAKTGGRSRGDLLAEWRATFDALGSPSGPSEEAAEPDLEFPHQPAPLEVASEVRDIIIMYMALQTFVQSNPESQFKNEDVIFPGFDLNDEPTYYGCADDMINRDGEFPSLWMRHDSETGGKYMNSHSPLLASYRRMLTVWRQTDSADLLEEQVSNILLEANYHPAARQEPGHA